MRKRILIFVLQIVFIQYYISAQDAPSSDCLIQRCEPPDLIPRLSFDESALEQGDSSYIIVELSEIAGWPTNGSEMSFFVPYTMGLDFEFDNTMSSIRSTSMLENHAAEFSIRRTFSSSIKDTVSVFMRSNSTIEFPFNQVSTSQITLRVPTGELAHFDGMSTQSTLDGDNNTFLDHNNGHWINNARFSVGKTAVNNEENQFPGDTLGAHIDGNEYDYISFGLANLGDRDIEFIEGEEIPLFSFTIPSTSCAESFPIHILDHVEDSIILNNGVSSPNNAMTVLGGRGDIYFGNYRECESQCEEENNELPCYSNEEEGTREMLEYAVNNTQWTATDLGTGLLFSSNSIIGNSSFSRLGIKVKAIQKGFVSNLTFNLVPYSGGELNADNNAGILPISVRD